MKIEISPKELEFRPLTIALTFESKDEAKMWAWVLEKAVLERYINTEETLAMTWVNEARKLGVQVS